MADQAEILETWSTAWYLLTGLIGISLILIIKRVLFLTKLPPGPWGFPIIGSIIHLNRNNALHEFEKYRQKYGQIFSVGIGDSNVIVINGYKSIQEALKQDSLNGRPDFEIFKVANGGARNRGVILCDADARWSEHRRFILRSLREFGFGKISMEGLLLHELEELIKHIRKYVGKPVCPRHFFNVSIFNSLWHILTGNRVELDNEMFLKIVSMITTAFQNSYIAGPGQFFLAPFKILKRKFWNSAKQLRREMLNLVKTQVTEHEASYQEGVTRDFIDLYLQQRKAKPDSTFGSEEGMMNLVVDLKDLFLGGVETTSTTLFWSILYLTQHPEVQVKVQDEIDAVIGRTRLPSRQDKPKLLYVEAVLNEVHRKCSLFPVSVYHKALQDTHFEGFFFPKGSIIFPNLYEAHHNRDYWKDPENFRPERFLNDNGTELIKHEPLMPFSTGKRVCLGETLSRDTLFLFFTSLFQHFSWKLAPDSVNASLTDVPPTLITSPKDFNVIITARN